MLTRARARRRSVTALVLVLALALACGEAPETVEDPSADPTEPATEEVSDDPTEAEEVSDDPTEADVEPSDPTELETEPAPATDVAEPTDPPAPAVDELLEDGRHPTFLADLDVTARAVTFDLIQFLTGDEAIAAYEEDVPDDPDPGPPNDYWIRNVNPRLRTLPIAPDATVTVVRLGEPSGADGVPWTLDELPAHLALGTDVPAGRLGSNPFWLTVEDGVVVAIDEQYLP
jgi:hypothetical protein